LFFFTKSEQLAPVQAPEFSNYRSIEEDVLT